MILPIVLFIVSKIVGIYGHGRLMDPPARNSMWRLGFKNPVNYNDNGLSCGGYFVNQHANKGKCGVCGDNYANPVPRAHEDGGKYGNGILVRRYKVGQHIPITAELTANHKGHMEIKICPKNDPNETVTQECLDSHPLNIVGKNTHKYYLSRKNSYSGKFSWDAQLPPSMTCSQCVIQWTYVAGNNWGRCKDGTQGGGCGPQETFVNCADVAILSHISPLIGRTVSVSIPNVIFYSGDEFKNVVRKNDSAPDDEMKPLHVSSQLCLPVGELKNDVGMKDWCRTNCLKYPPECPPEKCECVYDCEAVGEFAKENEAKIYCLQNCLKFPSYCPEERCKCT